MESGNVRPIVAITDSYSRQCFVFRTVSAGNLVNSEMVDNNSAKLNQSHHWSVIFADQVMTVQTEKVNGHASQGEDYSVQAVLMPDDQRLRLNSPGKHIKDNTTARKGHVHCHRKMVEPSAFKAQVSLCGLDVSVTVCETTESEKAQGFVKVDRVFFGD